MDEGEGIKIPGWVYLLLILIIGGVVILAIMAPASIIP